MSLGYCYSKTVNFTPNCVKRAFFLHNAVWKRPSTWNVTASLLRIFFRILNSTLRVGGGNSKNLNLFSKRGGSVFIVEVTFFQFGRFASRCEEGKCSLLWFIPQEIRNAGSWGLQLCFKVSDLVYLLW